MRVMVRVDEVERYTRVRVRVSVTLCVILLGFECIVPITLGSDMLSEYIVRVSWLGSVRRTPSHTEHD